MTNILRCDYSIPGMTSLGMYSCGHNAVFAVYLTDEDSPSSYTHAWKVTCSLHLARAVRDAKKNVEVSRIAGADDGLL